MPIAASNKLVTSERQALCPELDEVLYWHLGLSLSQAENPQTKREIWEECGRDPAFFLFGGFVRTFDAHTPDDPWKMLPNDRYLHEALVFIHGPEVIKAQVKSRQILVSWLYAGYCVWLARFHKSSLIMNQCKTAEDSWSFVFSEDWLQSRCGFIEYALPPLLWPDDGQVIKATRGKLLYPWGSKIWAMARGAHKFRSYTGSLVFLDEVCYTEDSKESYDGALAMVKGGGRLRLVSTAMYGSWYGDFIEAATHLEAA